MLRLLLLFVLLLLCIVFSASAAAQLYEYRDANGNIRFTDDLGNVPENQRENVKRIQEVYNSSAPPEEQKPAMKINNSTLDADGPRERDPGLMEIGEALWKEQARLKSEYKSIEKERALLAEPPDENASNEEIEAYANKVDKINQLIRAYQERLQDHEMQVKAYNSQLEE